MQGVAHFISGIQQGGLELNLSLLLLCLGLFQTGNVGTAIEQGLRQRTDGGSQQFARLTIPAPELLVQPPEPLNVICG